MGRNLPLCGQLGVARSRQDESKEVWIGGAGSKRASSGGNGGHHVWWGGLISRLLQPGRPGSAPLDPIRPRLLRHSPGFTNRQPPRPTAPTDRPDRPPRRWGKGVGCGGWVAWVVDGGWIGGLMPGSPRQLVARKSASPHFASLGLK
jgi:hypothetical protein